MIFAPMIYNTNDQVSRQVLPVYRIKYHSVMFAYKMMAKDTIEVMNEMKNSEGLTRHTKDGEL